MKNLKLLAFFVLLSGTQLNAMNNEASAVVKTMADRTEDGSSSQQPPKEQDQDTLLNKGIPGFLKCLDDYIQQEGWKKPAAQLEPMTPEELVKFNNQLISYLRNKWLSLEYQVLWQAVQVYREQEDARTKSSVIEGDTRQPITAHDELPDILAGISPRSIASNLVALAAFMDTNYNEITQLRGFLSRPIDNTNVVRLNGEFELEYLEFFIGQIKDNPMLYKQFIRFTKQEVNLKAICENKLLHKAAQFNYVNSARLFIAVGADVNACDNDGDTPLHKAATCGYAAIAQILIKADADVNARENNRETPLHFATRYGYFEIAQMLIDAGAYVNTRDFSNNTPLHKAATCGYTAIAQILIKAGADVNTRNNDGHTPLDMAKLKLFAHRKNRDHEKTIELLEQAQQREHAHRMRATVALLPEAPVASTSLHNILPNITNSMLGKLFGSDHA